MSKSVSEQNIDEVLKEIGYNDTPLRREVKQAVAKWIQQEQNQLGDLDLVTNRIAYEVYKQLLEKLRK